MQKYHLLWRNQAFYVTFFKTVLLALDFWRTDSTFNNLKVIDFSNFLENLRNVGKKKELVSISSKIINLNIFHVLLYSKKVLRHHDFAVF